MSQQPELISPPLSASPASEPRPRSGPTAQPSEPHGRIPRWLIRAELLLRVMVRIYVGLALCYFTWSEVFWNQNPLFLQFPLLSPLAASGALRGILSGLGLLNIWIAMKDAIRAKSV